jgi:light-harvesting protein B-800-850 alpha chain
MNNAKMWLVVKPTVGIPLFLSGVAITSLVVHASVMTNTTWVGTFWQGKPKVRASLVAPGTDASSAVVVFNSSSTLAADGAQEATVVLPDGRTAKVSFQVPTQTTAMVDTDRTLTK